MENAYYWGKVTSRINFGEPDYLWSATIAELWNTCSNVAFVFFGCLGVFYARARPMHVRLAHVCMVATGIASALFHATLQFQWHMFDEISESWMVLVLFYMVLCPGAFPWFVAITHGVTMSLLIVHINGFCELHLICLALPTVLMTRRRMVHEDWVALFAAALRWLWCGVGVWLLEVALASHVAILQINGVGWSHLIQLHACWHVFMSVGIYLITVCIVYYDAAQLGDCPGHLRWVRVGTVPVCPYLTTT